MAKLGHRLDNENNTYLLDVDELVAQRAVNSLTLNTLLSLAMTSGLTDGETFDTIEAAVNGSGAFVLEFSLGTICQFQLVFNLNSSISFSIVKRDCEFPLLTESGDFLVQENGDKILAQGAI